MDNRNFSDLGEEIRDIVQNAVNTMDFHQLNRDIGNTVKGALDEVRHSIGSGYGGYRQDRGDQRNREYRRDREYQRERGYQRGREYESSSFHNVRQNESNTAQAVSPQRSQQTQVFAKAFPCEPVGRVSGILCTVFGSIGMGLFGIGAFVLALIGQLSGSWGLFGTIVVGLIPFFGLSGILSAKGRSVRKRLQRFRRYIGLFQGRPYYSIKELAAGVGQSPKFVLRDLRRMISIGMFPEGRIDDQGTCLMLNRESYIQYLELQKNIRLRSEGEAGKEIIEEQKKTENLGNPAALDRQVRQAIEAGRACIRQIREANDAIPGEEISRKLDRLENVIGKIFSYIEEHPHQLVNIQKFMEYYLPTTLKLVNAYKEFEEQSIQGENITSAKKEIEETLDTINLAFENLLDSLFVDVAMDVSSDISVLETLLAQEGLTQKDFASNE